MKSFSEYLIKIIRLFSINEQAPKGVWRTMDNRRHVLIDPDSGEILSGTLKGTDIDDYGDNIEKKSKPNDVETVHHKAKFMDISDRIARKVQNHLIDIYDKVQKIIEKIEKTSCLPKELQKHISTSEFLKKAKKLFSSPEVIKMHSLQQELDETYKKLDKEKDPQKIKELEDRISELEDERWDDKNKSAKEKYYQAIEYCHDILYTSELKKKGITCYTNDESDVILKKGLTSEREITSEERKACRTYTGDEYELINGYLSYGTSELKKWDKTKTSLVDEEKMKKHIAIMDSAISTSRLAQDTTLLRGINSYEAEKLLKLGSYQNERFLSTTIGITTADNFGTRDGKRNILIINLPKGYNGLPVKSFSKSAHENEILLPRNCNFKLKKKIDGNDGTTYYVVEPE